MPIVFLILFREKRGKKTSFEVIYALEGNISSSSLAVCIFYDGRKILQIFEKDRDSRRGRLTGIGILVGESDLKKLLLDKCLQCVCTGH